MKLIICAIILFCSGAAVAQTHIPKSEGRPVTPYPPLREADVVYAKRIQRIIDTREKKNMVMNWPGNPFAKVILNLATIGPDKQGFGEVKMYKTDSLTNPMTIGEYEKLTLRCETIEMQDTTTDDIYAFIPVEVCTPVEAYEIKWFLVTEEWIFDKQRGQYFPRIVSIAPLRNMTIAGVDLGEQPLFYVKYDDLRPYIVKEEAFNRQNSATHQTYYDFFEQRMFSSYITKESNMYDYAINQMPEFKDNPMEGLYESERIKDDLMNREMDFWEY
jgi:gliding motility associated protien GldN